MIVLSKEQVLALHRQLITETGGARGLADDGLLESALAAPFAGFDDIEFYPTLEQKAARLGYGLITNHPFVDGNKPIGVHVMLVYLALNGVRLEYSQQQLVDIVISVADGEKGLEGLTEWVMSHRA